MELPLACKESIRSSNSVPGRPAGCAGASASTAAGNQAQVLPSVSSSSSFVAGTIGCVNQSVNAETSGEQQLQLLQLLQPHNDNAGDAEAAADANAQARSTTAVATTTADTDHTIAAGPLRSYVSGAGTGSLLDMSEAGMSGAAANSMPSFTALSAGYGGDIGTGFVGGAVNNADADDLDEVDERHHVNAAMMMRHAVNFKLLRERLLRSRQLQTTTLTAAATAATSHTRHATSQ